MGTAKPSRTLIRERYLVDGMTCGSCVARVKYALKGVPGVSRTSVDIETNTATVEREPEVATRSDLARAVAAAGYSLRPYDAPIAARGEKRSAGWDWRPFVVGVAAAAALLALYLFVATLAQGWEHALQLFAEDAALVVAIAIGFGIQAGLFARLRTLHARVSGKSLAATGGTSTATMLACCAHHLVDLAPFVGLAGVATLLGAYKVQLLWLGLVGNGLGIVYLAHQVRRCAGRGGAAPVTAATEP